MTASDSLLPARDQEGKCGYCPHQKPCDPGKCDPRGVDVNGSLIQDAHCGWEVSFREPKTGFSRRAVYAEKHRAEAVAQELREMRCTAVVVKPNA